MTQRFQQLHIKKIIGIVLLISLIVLFWYSLKLQGAFIDSVDVLKDLINGNENLGILIFTGLAAASAILSPFSSVPLIPFAIEIWGKFQTIVMLQTGWLLGGFIAYHIGRYAGLPTIKALISIDKVEHYTKRLKGKNEFWYVLLFRYMLPSELGGYLLGLLRFNFWKYLAATLITELPFAIATVYMADAILERNLLMLIIWGITIILLVGLMYYLFKKHLKNHRSK